MLDAVFFFSSRRRHTRSLRDWSSDVCSSDLITAADGNGGPRERGIRTWSVGKLAKSAPGKARTGTRRSEERRVGKECRSRREQYLYKKNSENRTRIGEDTDIKYDARSEERKQ